MDSFEILFLKLGEDVKCKMFDGLIAFKCHESFSQLLFFTDDDKVMSI